ncbi:radial spoke head protein 4 homolog A isoform X2 [Maniola jurtina]|uniref:radial spoke head protein 4 homolog A isoform X2 n=1 Tax=Maniola jurtina TaxID=191418 RepID=UPI001E68691C|nr:radial spoke head protein 4 homolog A isoform X2 [Maniola jurtina]
MSQTFLLEPDIIAAAENVMPDLNNDLVLAKNFLKQQCAATGDTLYDHLVDVVHKILSQKPPDVVDQFEQYSWEVKQEKFRPNFDLLNDIYLSPPQLQLVRRVEEMFQLVASKSLRLEEVGEEQELDLEEESVKPRIADLIEHNYYFREGGYGLPDSECYALYVALNMLAIKEPVAAVRFFGKIFGTRMNYYVAEADLTIEELDRRIRVYYVCNLPGEPWIGLPDVTPAQIRVARLTVRCMTGDLDAEVLTFPPFEGTERNYLRAQIARIAASTSISPQGFYTFGSGEEEEDIDLEEGAGDLVFNPNPFYQGHTLKDLLDPNLTYWVHHGRYILKQGRTLWWNPNAVMEEGVEEEEDEGPPPIPPESGPALFTPLSEDVRIEGLNSWSARVSSTLMPDRAVAVLRSNIWPGAVAYSTSGKKSECLYVGWGLKFQPPNFSPVQLPRPQDEYVIGPEVMEMADPTFADEEAYRIAHLPPPPPPEQLGEGEGFPLEEEEED